MENVHACLGNRSSNLVKQREMRREGNSKDPVGDLIKSGA